MEAIVVISQCIVADGNYYEQNYIVVAMWKVCSAWLKTCKFHFIPFHFSAGSVSIWRLGSVYDLSSLLRTQVLFNIHKHIHTVICMFSDACFLIVRHKCRQYKLSIRTFVHCEFILIYRSEFVKIWEKRCSSCNMWRERVLSRHQPKWTKVKEKMLTFSEMNLSDYCFKLWLTLAHALWACVCQ